MKINRIYKGFCLILLISALLCTGVTAYSSPEAIVAASKVYISSVTSDPGTFFTGDTGTITFSVANANTNDSSVVSHVTLGGNDIQLTSLPYDSTTHLGPLQTQKFIFSVVANAKDGIYYPTFSLSFRDADNLFYRPMVQVENRPLELTIIDKPDAFTQGKKKTINLQVANPRKGDVRNVILDVAGDGITATPSRTFIGNLSAGGKIPVNVSITPDKETPLHLTLTYDNGNNPHLVSMDIPITFGVDKKQADPVMSNVKVTTEGGIYHVTGDINNAGLDTANTVTVTSLAPAIPQDPYKTYVVGALKADDFGGFEVTFDTDGSTSIPIQMTFKDSDGNLYNSVQNVTVPSNSLGVTTASNGPPVIPVLAALVLIAALVGGWYFYIRKSKK
ncbi:MAG: CARDB domain-containing protein [Methanoregula sp.]